MTKKSTIWEKNEKILYIIVWSAIAMLPIVLELWKLINGSEPVWKSVVNWWGGMIPLILIFLLHNHVLIPQLLKRGRTVCYAASVCAILLTFGVLFFCLDCCLSERRMKMPPPQHIENAGVRPPAPLPRPHDGLMPPREPGGPHHPPGKHPPAMFPLPVLFKLLLVLLTIGANAAVSLSFSYNRQQAYRKELENRRLQEELKYLKQQISPHFLMNVLNNIHEMAEENIKEAQNMILELSYLMRYVLYESENDMTTLAAELRFISSYVSLMRKRYIEELVTVKLDVPESCPEGIRIPPLLFIPFIENAFKHGVSYNNETMIDVSLSEAKGKIRFTCSNTLQRKSDNDIKGGVGLANVKRRLDLIYGNDYSLRIDKTIQAYSVILIIPSL